jgi:hypothetical protein
MDNAVVLPLPGWTRRAHGNSQIGQAGARWRARLAGLAHMRENQPARFSCPARFSPSFPLAKGKRRKRHFWR